MSIDKKGPLFKNPIESNNGLSIDDLNKYLPAINKIQDLSMTANQMRDGLFLGLAIDGIKKIPNDSIDIIITEPPESPLEDINNTKKPITIQKYFEWNKNWLRESYRILKQTGSIYLICGWKHSAMYQSLLNSFFKIPQTDKRCGEEIMPEINRELLKRFYKPIYIPIIAIICCFLIILPKSASNGIDVASFTNIKFFLASLLNNFFKSNVCI